MTTPAQAFTLLRGAGVSPSMATILTAVGGAESGWNPNAIGDVNLQDATWGPSVGIWQVRTLKAQTGTGGTRDINALKGNPTAQARAAASILHGQGLGAWTTYSSGAYKKFLGTSAKNAAAAGSTSTTGQNAGLLDGLGGAVTNGAINGFLPLPGVPQLGAAAAGAGAGILDSMGQSIGGGIAAAGGALFTAVEPPIVTAAFAVAGIGLVILGLAITAKPTTEKLRAEMPEPDPSQVAALAAL